MVVGALLVPYFLYSMNLAPHSLAAILVWLFYQFQNVWENNYSLGIICQLHTAETTDTREFGPN